MFGKLISTSVALALGICCFSAPCSGKEIMHFLCDKYGREQATKIGLEMLPNAYLDMQVPNNVVSELKAKINGNKGICNPHKWVSSEYDMHRSKEGMFVLAVQCIGGVQRVNLMWYKGENKALDSFNFKAWQSNSEYRKGNCKLRIADK